MNNPGQSERRWSVLLYSGGTLRSRDDQEEVAFDVRAPSEDEARVRAFRLLKRSRPDENPMNWTCEEIVPV